MATIPLPSRLLTISGALVGLLVLGGCSAAAEPAASVDDEDVAAPDTEPAASPAASEAEGAAITCDAIAPLAAPITSTMTFSADDSSEDPSSTVCVWLTDDVAAGTTDIAGYGSVALGIDGTGWTPEDLDAVAATGTIIDDPRAAAVDGRVLLLGGGETLAEAGSVQLLFPEGTVTVVATGAALAATAPETAVPIDDVIGVAADVAALRR